jgi:hypothetical protein
MKTQDDVIQALGGLSDRDRAWIIERLSPQSRSALMNGVTAVTPAKVVNATPAGSPAAASSAVAITPSNSRLSPSGSDLVALADAQQIASVLQNEPVWVAHSILSRPWPWRDELRGLLPPLLQSELQHLDGLRISHSANMVDLVVEKVAGMVDGVVLKNKPSKFETLVASLGVKLARKRMSLRT